MTKERLRRQILAQEWVSGNGDLADKLVPLVEVVRYEQDESLYTQEDDYGETGYYLWMVLSGTGVTLNRSGHRLYRARPGDCFGEFPLLDPRVAVTVTATVTAGTEIARLPEESFHELADACPDVGINLARMLVHRLAESHTVYRPANERPVVFVGSSVEALSVLQAVEVELQYETGLELSRWTGDVFKPGDVTIEALMEATRRVDFAVLFATADDVVDRRGSIEGVPRDNVIFELGLFMGSLGRARTLLVQPRDPAPRLPSDLLGVTVLSYARDSHNTPAVGPIATAIRTRVSELGPLARLVDRDSAISAA